MAYTKQTWNDLPNTTTPVTATRLNHIEDGIYGVSTTTATTSSAGLMSASDKTTLNALATSVCTTLWSGDLTATAVNTDSTTGRFDPSSKRPYNYTMCFAHFNIDGTHMFIPFKSPGYGTGVTFCGYWAISSSTHANLTFYYSGYDTFAFQVKEISGKNVSQVHLIEVYGIK